DDKKITDQELLLADSEQEDNEAMEVEEPLETEVEESKPEAREGGLLPVSREAINRYDPRRAREIRPPTAEELQQVIYERETPQPSNETEFSTSATTTVNKETIIERPDGRAVTLITAAEFLRLKREKKLKK